MLKNQLLEGPTLKRIFLDETEAFGFWMVPANCDVLGGMGLSQVHRSGGEFHHMKNTYVHMSNLEPFTKKVTETA
jgi:hypothetical protein